MQSMWIEYVHLFANDNAIKEKKRRNYSQIHTQRNLGCEWDVHVITWHIIHNNDFIFTIFGKFELLNETKTPAFVLMIEIQCENCFVISKTWLCISSFSYIFLRLNMVIFGIFHWFSFKKKNETIWFTKRIW